MKIPVAFCAFLFVVVLATSLSAGEFLTMEITGTGNADSIFINLTVTDTTLYPTITDPDDLYILVFAPPNYSTPDSFHISSANVHKMRTGWYCAHIKAAAPGPVTGMYKVYASVQTGGAWRGHVAGSYYVQSSSLEAYLASVSSDIELLHYFLGSCDGCTKVYLPNDGTAYKNGYEVWAGGQKKITVTFGHSNVQNVLDSAATTKEY